MSGAPEKEQNHAQKVCDMALDMIEAITDLKDPSTGQHLKIRELNLSTKLSETFFIFPKT